MRNIHQILKGVLKHLKDMVKKNWQVRSIGMLSCLLLSLLSLLSLLPSLFLHILFPVYIIEKLLFIENTHTVRMLGFELLLLFLEVIGSPDKFKLALLSASMNFPAFMQDYHNRDIKFPTTTVSIPTGERIRGCGVVGR
jgi:hypothetical protein